MTGLPYLFRISGAGLRSPRIPVRGTNFAGRIELVGQGVSEFRPGDQVFGICAGAFADYATARPGKIAAKPANLTFEQAAAVPTSGFTALQALRDIANVQDGQTVLIIGAGGAVGSFAVQIAKAFGAHVSGVCSTSKVDLVRDLGADAVIDYTRDDFTATGEHYDVIVDTAGNRPASQLRRVLTSNGTLVIVGGEGGGRWLGALPRTVRALMVSPFVRQNLRTFVTKERQEDLVFLMGLIEAGKVTPVIGKTFTLSEVPEAVRYLEAGHARGKVVITVCARPSSDIPEHSRRRGSCRQPSVKVPQAGPRLGTRRSPSVEDAPMTVPVTVENFVRAETDRMFAALQVDAGGVNTLHPRRAPAPIEHQTVIRMNRDTLYSLAVVDISKGATVSIPDSGDRYLSVMVVNQDHYINRVLHEAGGVRLDGGRVRHAWVTPRCPGAR